MAPKKAAKKQAAKKAKKHGKHGSTGDLRRAYEHLNRVGLLRGKLESETRKQVDALSQAAKSALAEQEIGSAADLLRAAEHVSFGSMVPVKREPLNEQLAEAAKEQYEQLTDRASEHWEKHDESAEMELSESFHAALAAAEEAYDAGAMYRALEYARAAEALTHVRPGKHRRLKESPKPTKKLRAEAAR